MEKIEYKNLGQWIQCDRMPADERGGLGSSNGLQLERCIWKPEDMLKYTD
jgi:hypothetical protein